MSEAPYFFLGYAHTPERLWVDRFYRALSAEIVERTDWDTRVPPGFMDESGIRPGTDWRDAVAGALATCRVLVPLYSRRYFTRIECGREWHAFQRRMLAHGDRYGATPIVPALWTPVPEQYLPESVRHIQANFPSVHPVYAEEGLYTLIRNGTYRSTYLRVVKHLATQIIDAAESRPLGPCGVSEVDLSRNAFERPPQDIPVNRRLSIMVAAPTRQRLVAGRSPESYGPTAQAWAPYRPGVIEPIAEAAARIARSYDYEPDIVGVDEGLHSRDWSDPGSGLGLVLVDPWLALDPDHAEQLRRIDELGAGRIGAVVVWNKNDPQTGSTGDEIRQKLQLAAPRLLGDPGVPAALGAVHVSTPEQFNAELPGALDRAFNRYLSHVPAEAPAGRIARRPQLYGSPAGPASIRPQYSGGHDED